MDPVTTKTMSVPKAGREYYGLGRNASYEAARRGDIPTIRVGRLLRVPVAAMERKLDQAGSDGPAAGTARAAIANDATIVSRSHNRGEP